MTIRELLGRIPMSIAAIIVGVLPLRIDLGPSHILNPAWTAHARLHGVWLLATGALLALFSLYLIWIRRDDRRGALGTAGVILACLFGGFFVATATVAQYGGGVLVDSASDAGLPLADMVLGVPTNVLVFAVATTLLVIGLVLARGAARSR
jgi:hypothetical protein